MTDALHRTVLDNGVRVVSEGVAGARSLAVGVWLAVGSRDEPADAAGLSHLLEHLIFKGTERRDARSLALAFDAVGGEMNAYTSKERTAYYARVPAGPAAEVFDGETWTVGVELLLESVVQPALRAEELASEREVVLEELAGAEDDPSDLVDTRLFELLFPGHPLGREVIGTPETVANVTRERILAFMAEHYGATNVVVAAAGVVDHSRLVDAVGRWLGGWAPGQQPTRTPAASPSGSSRLHTRRRTEQTHLALGWPTVGLHHEDRFTLAILEHVLGDGPASRLFQEIRERRGLAYTVGSSLSTYTDAGALTVYVGTSPDRATEVLRLVEQEVASIAAAGITEEELRAAQGYLVGATLLGLEEAWTTMSRLGYLEATYGVVEPVEAYLDRVRAVSLDDVARVAAATFAQPSALATVGPRSPARPTKTPGRARRSV